MKRTNHRRMVWYLFIGGTVVIGLTGCMMHKASMAEIHYSVGVDALRALDHQKAIDSFTRALNESPNEKGPYFNESATYVNRGMAYAKMADFQSAERDFSSALQVNPANPVAYQNRGYVLAKMKRYTEAIVDLDKAIDLAPSYSEAYFSRAQVYELQNDRVNALRDYNSALSLMRQHGQGRSEYAVHIERKIAEYEKAGPAMGEAVQPHGPATELIRSYLTVAASLDASATRNFLSANYVDDIVTEFQVYAQSGWRLDMQDTTIISEMVDTSHGKATVTAKLSFKGGTPGHFTWMQDARPRTFSLVLQSGSWKISCIDPKPRQAGPGVEPLMR